MTRCKACDNEIDYGEEELCELCLGVVFEDIASDSEGRVEESSSTTEALRSL